MKKIITGYIYRMFRSFEIWALIALLILASSYLFIMRMNVTYNFGNGQFSLFDEEMKQYRFESLDISDEAVYKYEIETISYKEFDVLANQQNYAQDEVRSLFAVLGSLVIIPAALMVILIPIFFGRLFSDGTIKNLIACGYSNRQIYMSAFVLTWVIDVLLIAIEVGLYALICLCYRWHPPVYLPAMSAMVLLQILMLLTISTVCLAVLFASAKKIAPLVAGFVLVALIFIPISAIPVEILWESTNMNNDSFTELASKMKEDRNRVNMRFDLKDFDIDFTYEGEDLLVYEDTLSPAVKTGILAWTYLDPFMLAHPDIIYVQPYLFYRDGLIAVYSVTNVFWTILSSSVGLVIFKKKELS